MPLPQKSSHPYSEKKQTLSFTNHDASPIYLYIRTFTYLYTFTFTYLPWRINLHLHASDFPVNGQKSPFPEILFKIN